MDFDARGRLVARLVFGGMALFAGAAARADEELPAALSALSTVCSVSERSSQRSASIHSHKSLKNWNLKPGKTKIEIDEKWFSDVRYGFDKKKSWINEIQNPSLYVINPGGEAVYAQAEFPNDCPPPVTYPGPAYPVPMFGDPNFVFAFGIHKIINNKQADEWRSPHALIYIPIRTRLDKSQEQHWEFEILLFHMEPDEKNCPNRSSNDFGRQQCEALVRLRKFWEKKKYTADEFKAEIMKEIRYILDVRPIDKADDATKKKGGEFGAKFVVYVMNHNGVIHGIF